MGVTAQKFEIEPLGCALGAATVYRALRSMETDAARADQFLAHIYACAFAIAIEEAYLANRSVGEALGLDRAALEAIAASWLPGAAGFVTLGAEPPVVARDDEEAQLFELLSGFQADDATETQWVMSIVARRAMAPRHLWQDLGLRDRCELSALIARFFPRLAADNVGNMKWKKFFYRKICELEGFGLCAVPTCRECADFDACFGEEEGESVLARIVNS